MNEIVTRQGNRAYGPARAADEKFCFSCGNVLHISAADCTKCGAVQANTTGIWTAAPPAGAHAGGAAQAAGMPPNHIYCHGCGTAIHQHAASCPKCGAPQGAKAAAEESGKDKVIAAVLAFFLGGFGAHKFYLGSPMWGLLYLLLCWTFIPACIALIEGIYYLTLSDKDFKGKYR
ncbi:TM2 domain-containing protein [Paraburkholderia caledonica]|uniref:TM2 domain-containing protein n=1 Tax=Paraburkholderia caledonica TaxID=134536 RepID=UPI0038B98540